MSNVQCPTYGCPTYGWAGWTGMPDGPDGVSMRQVRMESGWAGMPDGSDGVCRMGPGWLPTAQTMATQAFALPNGQS